MANLPSGYKIRVAQAHDAKEITLVHLNTWKTSYQGILEQSFLDALELNNDRLNFRKNLLKDADIHLVITFNEKVIAFADAGSLRSHKHLKDTNNNHELGELYAIYVLKEHQALGLGKILFQTCSRKLQERGLMPFVIWALKDNLSANQFYQKLGGTIVDEILSTIGNRQYSEVAYQFI